ncbi:hypothetical protein N9U05_00380 [bacterium]|nr:hypothetical protein [bacterium]
MKIPIVSSVPEEGAASISEVVVDSSSWQDTIYIDIIGVDDMYDEDDQSYTIKIGPTNTTGGGYNNFEFSLDYINADDDAYGRSKALMYREEDMLLTRIPFGAAGGCTTGETAPTRSQRILHNCNRRATCPDCE